MTTTSEGAEIQTQLNEVRALGCAETQGYLFSTPKSAAELSSLLRPRIERLVGSA